MSRATWRRAPVLAVFFALGAAGQTLRGEPPAELVPTVIPDDRSIEPVGDALTANAEPVSPSGSESKFLRRASRTGSPVKGGAAPVAGRMSIVHLLWPTVVVLLLIGAGALAVRRRFSRSAGGG